MQSSNNDIKQVSTDECKIEKYGFEIISVSELIEFFREYPELAQPHSIDFYSLIFVTEGTGTFFIDYEEVCVNKGEILFLSRNQVLQYVTEEYYEGFSISFAPNFIYHSDKDLEILNKSLIFNALLKPNKLTLDEDFFRMCQLYFKDMMHEYSKKDSPLWRDIISYQLKSLLLKFEMIKSEYSQDHVTAKYYTEYVVFIETLEQNFVSNKRVDFYSHSLGVSEKKLNEITKYYHKKNAKDIIDDRVMIEIKRILANTNMSIKEIAYKFSFNDNANFVNYFKKKAAMTPSEFRDRNLNVYA